MLAKSRAEEIARRKSALALTNQPGDDPPFGPSSSPRVRSLTRFRCGAATAAASLPPSLSLSPPAAAAEGSASAGVQRDTAYSARPA
jgi:hypothetical protein